MDERDWTRRGVIAASLAGGAAMVGGGAEPASGATQLWCMCGRPLGCKGRATEFDGGATAVMCPAFDAAW